MGSEMCIRDSIGTHEYSSNFSFRYSRVLSHFSFWYPRDSLVLMCFGTPGTREYLVSSAFGAPRTREYSVISALVLQVFASTQVILAVGTPCTGEYSSHFSSWYSRYTHLVPRKISKTSHQKRRDSLFFPLFLLWSVVARFSRVLSYFSFGYSRYSRVLSHFSCWCSRYSRESF